MRRNTFGIAGGAMLLLGLLLAATSARAQMRGNAPGNAQPNAESNPMGTQPQDMGAGNRSETFFAEARRNSSVETDLSKMALKNSSNDGVKKLAHHVIQEDRKNEMALLSVMNSTNPSAMSFPTPVPSQTRKAEKQMKKLKGKQFDGMYLAELDGYVKDDERLGADVSANGSFGGLTPLAMQLQNAAQEREKQIAQVAESEGIKLR